jgi:flagellin
MKINTNVGALGAARNLFMNNVASESSMRKLSSGLRISRAADDAAGLSIANKLRTQSRSLVQASNNAQQGNAMLQIAEGAASVVQRILERQKELFVQQASTGNNGSVSATLQAEIDTLSEEAERIINSTNFQGTDVFASLTFQVTDEAGGTIQVGAGLTWTAPTDLATVDSMLDTVNATLADIGAGQNRLDYTVENLKNAVVNIRAAESSIRDVDMAEEMATFTKNSVLSQAATAMLGQANQASQSILSILR